MQLNRHTEFLLSDHPEARRMRLLGRLQAATAEPAQLERWYRYFSHGDPLSDRERYRLEELRTDDVTVALARIEFERNARAGGASDYRYPSEYVGSAAAAQPNLLTANTPVPIGASWRPAIKTNGVDQHRVVLVDAAGLDEGIAVQRARLLLIEADDQPTITAAHLARQGLVDEQDRLAAALEAIPDNGPDPQSPATTRQNEALAEQLRWIGRDLSKLDDALQRAEHRQLRLLLGAQTDRAKVAALLTMASEDRSLLSPAEGNPLSAGDLEHFTIAQLRDGIAAAVAGLQALPRSRMAELAAVRADLERLGGYRRDHDQVLIADGMNGSVRRRPWARRSPHVSEQQRAAERIRKRWQELSDRLDVLTSGEAARTTAIEAARPSVRLGATCVSQLGARQDAAIEALTRRPPSYVVAELGHPPAADPARAVWQEGLYLIECYRLDHDITDPDAPLGTAPTRRAEALSHQLTTARLDALRAELGQPDHLGPNQSRFMDLFNAP